MSEFRLTQELQITNAPLDEVTQHPDNANNGDTEALKESIGVNGFFSPILVQASTGYIIAGNHRYQVAVEMGASHIPTIYIDVDDEQAKRMMLADNRITRMGADDPGLLLKALEELNGSIHGLAGTGFSTDDLNFLLEKANEPLKLDDYDKEPPEEKGAIISHRYTIVPMVDEFGMCEAFVLRDADGRDLQPADLNELRVALGLSKIGNGVLSTYDIPGWRVR